MHCVLCQVILRLAIIVKTRSESKFLLHLDKSNSLFRERILKFMTSLDEMISLPTDLQFKLLINRLPEAVVMAKVIDEQQSFNTSLRNLS